MEDANFFKSFKYLTVDISISQISCPKAKTSKLGRFIFYMNMVYSYAKAGKFPAI